MKNYSDLKIIDGIRKQDPDLLQYLYDKYYTLIRSMVETNWGDPEDAKDVFQEAIILIYRKMKNETFQLSSSFKTYLYSICWYIWMKERRSREHEGERIDEYKYLENNPESLSVEYELHRQYKLYQQHLKKLPKDCRKILKMYLKEQSPEKIAKKLGLKSENYVKKRKYICKELLSKAIKNDKRFKDDEYE